MRLGNRVSSYVLKDRLGILNFKKCRNKGSVDVLWCKHAERDNRRNVLLFLGRDEYEIV